MYPLSRRNFLKLNLSLLTSTWGLNIVSHHSETIPSDFILLDLLASLPFSTVVKKEVVLRVMLQKKYGIDSHGLRVELHRFHKENLNFILSKGFFDDLLYYMSHVRSYLDYVIHQAAYHNKCDVLEYCSSKIIGSNVNLYSKALFSALSNHSIQAFYFLMKLNQPIIEKDKKIIQKILSGERYANHLHIAKHFLPFKHLSTIIKRGIATLSSLDSTEFDEVKVFEPSMENIKEWIGTLLSSINYVFEKLEAQGEIVSFDANIEADKINIVTYANSYPFNFIELIMESLSFYIPPTLFDLIDHYNIIQCQCD